MNTLQESDFQDYLGSVNRFYPDPPPYFCEDHGVDFAVRVTGTATYGDDYELIFYGEDGIYVFGTYPNGDLRGTGFLSDLSAGNIIIDPVEDSISEGLETIIITLEPMGNNYTIDPEHASMTFFIEDNDVPTVTVTANEPLTGETTSSSPGQFTVTRNNLGTSDLTVHYAVGGTAMAGDDYPTLMGTVIIPSGETSAVIDVTLVNDGVAEADETVTVTLTADTAYLVGQSNSAAVTIADQIVLPIDVEATVLFPTTGIQLIWSDIPHETSYRVLRAEEGTSTWVEAGTTAADVLTFTDDTAIVGTTYTYRIEGINSAGLAGFGESQPIKAVNTDGDEDNDGLTNLEEYNLGTDIFYFDTDGDLLTDGWEVANGLDPFDSDENGNGISDEHDDFDDDGLTNLDESNFRINPHAPDTDGDGTPDADEVDQGSLPGDPGDGGDPPADETIAKFRVSVGDPSGSHSERWKITFDDLGYRPGDSGFEFVSPDFGQVGTDDFWFQTGESYEVRVVHLGTDPDYFAQMGRADYDWRAWIEPTPGEDEVPYEIDDNNSPTLLQQNVYFGYTTNYPDGMIAYFHVDPFNVTIDSNNDAVIDSQDDGSEETYGTNSHPGKVILVNDRDVDRDGLPDYVDGFDDLAQITDDDLSVGSTFTPLQVAVRAIEPQDATLIFDYDGSNPLGITASLTDPFILPPGRLRIWLVDGSTPRDPRPVEQGGDYIVPGVAYNAADLGFTSPSTRTFYVEAIREDTQISGSEVRVEVDPDGTGETIWEDTVRFHSVRFELLARERNDPVFESVLVGVLSNATLSHGFTVGADLIHKIRVYDARTNLSTITVEGTSISLQPYGPVYETSEFQLAESFGDVPGMGVLLSGVELDWSYNPSGSNGINKLDELSDWDNQLVEAVKQATDTLFGDGWTPADPGDPGAFGKEIHRLTSEALEGQDGWLTEVFVENGTNRILSFGDPPPGVPSANYTQVAFIRTKDLGTFLSDYYNPGVGDVIDFTKIEDVYDVKSSINGSMTQAQKQRLKSVLNGWGAPQTRDIKVAKTHLRYTTAQGWHENPKFRNGIRVLGMIGLAASAYSLLNFSGQEEALQAVVDEALRIQQVNDPDVRKADLITWLQGPVKTYLSYVIPDDTVLNIGVGAATYKVLMEIE